MPASTLTYAIRLQPSPTEVVLLERTCDAYLKACDKVSDWCHANKCLTQRKVQDATYLTIRETLGMPSQMAISATRRVIGNYRTIKETTGRQWGKQPIRYTSPGYDLIWNRDYSVNRHGLVSVNTLEGRVKLHADWTHVPDEYRQGRYGTARILQRNGKWLMLIPMTVNTPDPRRPQRVTGVDLGIRFLATAYDGDGKTTFYSGKEVTHRRAEYKELRSELQRKGTRSARKRLKSIGNRENRWMRDVNHQVSKALVNACDRPTLIVLEDLKGIRKTTEKAWKTQRYVQVSWAFFQLRQMIEYKAAKAGHTVLVIDPAYTSQACPKCGTILKTNRKKKQHLYVCANCAYTSNDDRVGAMNIQRIGYQSLLESGVSIP